MTDPGYTSEDLELFDDLLRAAEAIGVTPYLIGAGAIRLGASLRWGVRLGRVTRDWDFAIRVESWSQYEALAEHLVARTGGFSRAAEPHRFRHRAGGVLDVLPYGGVEEEAETTLWADGHEMNTTGFGVLEEEHEQVVLQRVAIQVASMPAIVGLKLLAYRDRRPGITRDIGDVHALLRDVEGNYSPDRIAEQALDRVSAGDVSFGEVGAYLLGRDVGSVFPANAKSLLCAMLQEVGLPEDRTVGDVLHNLGENAVARELVTSRLHALGLGIVDGHGPESAAGDRDDLRR